MGLATVLKGWLVLPTKHGGAVIRLMEKIHALDKLPSGRAYRVLAASSLLMNQDYTLNKDFLKTETRIKEGYVLIG